MNPVVVTPLVLGYLVFVSLAERLWPFSPPRGWVAVRRYRKGLAFGLFTIGVTTAALAALLLAPALGLPIAAGALAVAVLVLIRHRQSTRAGLSIQAVPDDGGGEPASGFPAAGGDVSNGASGHAHAGPAPEPVTAPPRSPELQVALKFLRTHRPDIVLDEARPFVPVTDFVHRAWTSRDRFEAVVATAPLDDEQRARFEQELGLPERALHEWREACERANDSARHLREERIALEHEHQARIAALQAQLARKDRALAEAATDLMLRERHSEQA